MHPNKTLHATHHTALNNTLHTTLTPHSTAQHTTQHKTHTTQHTHTQRTPRCTHMHAMHRHSPSGSSSALFPSWRSPPWRFSSLPHPDLASPRCCWPPNAPLHWFLAGSTMSVGSRLPSSLVLPSGSMPPLRSPFRGLLPLLRPPWMLLDRLLSWFPLPSTRITVYNYADFPFLRLVVFGDVCDGFFRDFGGGTVMSCLVAAR